MKRFTDWMEIEMTCADCTRILQRIMDMGVALHHVTATSALSVRFGISSTDFEMLTRFAQTHDVLIRILRRRGALRRLSAFFRRPVLASGIFLLLVLAMLLPERILFFEVQGNDMIPDKQILEAVEDCGIGFGISRRKIQNEKMKNALLSAIPELQWAGINTYGSLAVITVRERSPESESASPKGVSSIVAERDGVILSCTVTRGTGQVVPGQAVLKGEVLISGYTDCGLTIEATRAEGEVFGATSRRVTVKTVDSFMAAPEAGKSQTRFSLRIGKKRINFYKGSGILDTTCDKMRLEYVLTLPGGLQLPVSLIQETFSDRDIVETVTEPELIKKELSEFARQYLRGLMIAGTVTSGTESMDCSSGCMFSGIYSCHEMIGRVRDEEIGVYNGKTD